MDESNDAQDAAAAGVVRGRRYPGATIAEVIAALNLIHAAGGTIAVGRLAVRVGKSEKSSAFQRLTATMVSFGLARWQGTGRSMIELTEEGTRALSDDPAVKATALRAAFVLPDVFAEVAARFVGRALVEEDLTEAFLAAGVAPEGAAGNAARNFIESATTAGAAHQEGTKVILDGDIPLGEREPRPAPRQVAKAVPATRAAAVPKTAPPKQSGGAELRGGGGASPVEVPVLIQLDVSGWEVDAVVELVRRLRELPPDA